MPTKAGAKLKIEHLPTSKLRRFGKNPRQISAEELEKLCRSIQTFGMVDPIIARRADRMIIGGHQRVVAARKLDIKTVPVILVDLTKEQSAQLNIALNRISGDWDIPKLAVLIEELQADGADLSLTGFDQKELDGMFAGLKNLDPDGLTDPDAIPEAPKPITKPGDVWIMGPHRLICGDCTDPKVIKKLMAGAKAQMIFTDPPYAVQYKCGRSVAGPITEKGRGPSRKAISKQGKLTIRKPSGQRKVEDNYWDDIGPQKYSELLHKSLIQMHEATDKEAPIYIWFASVHIGIVIQALEDTNWAQRNLLLLIAWVKNVFAGSLFAQFKHKYEPCFYGHKRGAAPRWYGPNNETTVWEYEKPHKNEDQPTVKPVELPIRAIGNSSARGDLILDLFMGSGTTIIAAQKMGRRCYGAEVDARYVDVAIRRWEEFTGCTAILDKIGKKQKGK